MIHLTKADITYLHISCHMPDAAKALYNSCVIYTEYTDKVCDTYTCPNCPNYSWCTTLRGIANEGVKLE